ncbi:TssN family type VI secretion system protein [Hoylesella pleuritidis]|uniref:TssN family type VI secretion system protein n=1 Tax=Hoylesella pleuritidis TaxID=407975 RepID=UPI0028EA0937|nr:TssN family type VI secretion system protein [Hoylesella pleuritidis]
MKPLIIFFLKFLLAPLLAMLLLFITSALKSIRQKLSMKKVIIFSLLAGLCLGLPSLFGLLRNEFVWGGLILTVISYLLLGIFFLFALKSFMGDGTKDPDETISVLLILISGIVGMWIYYNVFDLLSGELPYTVWAMTTVLWFAIPFSVYCCFKLFCEIQPPIYALWMSNHSAFNRNYWDTFDNFKSKTVRVRIKRKTSDQNYTMLSVRLSDGISLGDWFDWMVEDQNKRFPQAKIDTRMDDPESGWIFYTSKWFKYPLFIRMLDPKLTGIENGIKKDQIIYIKRVLSVNHIQYEED